MSKSGAPTTRTPIPLSAATLESARTVEPARRVFLLFVGAATHLPASSAEHDAAWIGSQHAQAVLEDARTDLEVRLAVDLEAAGQMDPWPPRDGA